MTSFSEELVAISEQGVAAVLATVVEVAGESRVEAGAKCLVRDGKVAAENIGDPAVVEAILRESAARLSAEKSQLVSLDLPSGKLEVFFEVMPEPPKLIVVGAGHIAVPLVKIAKVLDFHVIVIDDRLLFANRERFPDADEVLVGDMARVLKEMTLTPACYIAEEVIERVYAPIGLDIGTETPAEIALSILGEVIKVRRGGKAASLSDR
ncbi:MAG: XdhC family protein [Deltaproteobacteria bacterium]|nr:XdhC family protein [Deltaproteobacteria bacterium]